MESADADQRAEMPVSASDGSGRNPRVAEDGASRPTARTEYSCPQTKQMMEAVVERKNMIAALRRVEANKGSAGVDNMPVECLGPYLREHWPRIKEQLLDGSYVPSPVWRVEIPKPGGKGMRQLGIPTVLDRLIQQALHQVMLPVFDVNFPGSSYGFGLAVGADWFGHGGAFATNMEIRPAKGLVIIWMVQHGCFPGDGANAQGVFRNWAMEYFAK